MVKKKARDVCPACGNRVRPDKEQGELWRCPACKSWNKPCHWLFVTPAERDSKAAAARDAKRGYRLEHLEDDRARAKRYRDKHKERINASRRERYASDREYRERVKARNRGER